MHLTNVRRARYSPAIVVVTLASFLSTLLPSRVSRADVSDAVAPIPNGTGGPSSLGAPPPSVTTPDALATVDLSTGAAQASYAFELPTGRGDVHASLGLRYNSSLGPGFAGVGWTLIVPSIVRKGASGIPKFRDDVLNSVDELVQDVGADSYVIDGQPLVPIAVLNNGAIAITATLPLPETFPPVVSSGRWAYFRREIDDQSRYFFNGATWIQQTKSGHILQFGQPVDNVSLGGSFGSTELADPVTANTLAMATTQAYRWNLIRESVGAKTYGQLTGSWWPGSYEALEANRMSEMNGAGSLHFNLEGMDMGRFAEFAKNPVMGPGNATNWELFTILKNPSLLGKTTFYGGVPPAL